ncbi:PQ-loop repeat-containing protein [Planosporangium thailandense]|uniref:PQ-loop repeat-containing protein n=1 Tax=Planosporangium thailandense TaxID=765197 RepID=A0ABX0XUC6_9ACTN|nr:SemiSWEET transporter [Planosporangium thailandense]NJC69615.1 PQ-loop repeat-containing protein [Planosporangium thailandense]
MTTAVFGWLAAAASMSLLWPQVWVSCARRRTEGLSPTATWLAAALPVGWLAYGALIGDGVQVVANTVTGTAAIAILVALLATQPIVRSRKALAAFGWPAVALIVVTGGVAVAAAAVPGLHPQAAAGALGSILAVVAVLSAVPQPLSLLRDRGCDVSGLSPARWWLGLCSGTLWTVYGLSTGQPAVWASSGFGLICTSTVCAFIIRGRRTAPATAAPIAYAVPATAGRPPVPALHVVTADYRRPALRVAA